MYAMNCLLSYTSRMKLPITIFEATHKIVKYLLEQFLLLSGYLYLATFKKYYKEHLSCDILKKCALKMVTAGMASSKLLNMTTFKLKKG